MLRYETNSKEFYGSISGKTNINFRKFGTLILQQRNRLLAWHQAGCFSPCNTYLTELTGAQIINNIFVRLTLLLIKAYQCVISPVFPPSCRFYPTCSAYTYQAVSSYGLVRGLFLSVKRILRCHPFHPGGIDPVPDHYDISVKAYNPVDSMICNSQTKRQHMARGLCHSTFP